MRPKLTYGLILWIVIFSYIKLHSQCNHAYVPNFDDNTVTVVDLATNSNILSIPVGTQPSGVHLNHEGTKAYVVNLGDNMAMIPPSVSVISTSTNTVIKTVPTTGLLSSIDITPDGKKAYIVDLSLLRLQVFDLTSETFTGSIPFAVNGIQRVKFSRDGKLAYVSFEDLHDRIRVVDVATDTEVLPHIMTMNNPSGMTTSLDDSKLYVVHRGADYLLVIDTNTKAITNMIKVGNNSSWVALSPDGTKLYVVNQDDNNITVINAMTETAVGTIPLGNEPRTVNFNREGTRAYVSVRGTNQLTVIDAVNDAVLTSVPVGSGPIALGFMLCQGPEPIPTVSEWGLIILGLSLLILGTLSMKNLVINSRIFSTSHTKEYK